MFRNQKSENESAKETEKKQEEQGRRKPVEYVVLAAR